MSTEPTVDLLYNEVEDELRLPLRALLADRCPAVALLARIESDEPYDTGLWRALGAELGVTGLSVPEEYGGAGAGWRETAVVLEELGRAVAPVPYLGSSVLVTAALMAADETRVLPEVAAGRRAAALAVPFSTSPGLPFPDAVRLSGSALSGTVTSVADALPARVLLVPATGAAGPGLYLVDLAAAGDTVTVTPRRSLDLTRPLADLTLRSAPAVPVALGNEAIRVLEVALTTGAALLASEQLGVAEWCLTTTVGYVRERHQFGRPVGSFQAVKHRLADLYGLVSQARAVARNAVAALDAGSPHTALEASLAQAFVSEAVVETAEAALQLHGGIGFTWEHPVHLYLKRAKSGALALGTADRHRSALALLVDLPPAA
ncbi:acyl-CoA/acyl-ACP dehydrogenase [Streptomyces sp. NA02950]|uniref:acyl-CoA dehydrogenase family protein n=1 Tax=Streptomyces sp. NA02950 TaxID=2742137 RepID=UPI0015924DA5|nr:acyl-CoA dehydrogenase family protein [Streptomyces sp. NA02950]QKV96606.1 acyl-CoA/acyl-ACP dehydrogenase [Streptomyces sp. NA02950]